jgi:hypothetical protein
MSPDGGSNPHAQDGSSDPTTPPRGSGQSSWPRGLVVPMRRILRVGSVAGALLLLTAALAGWLVRGEAGLWAGVVGALLPLGFFGVTVVVALASARMSATSLGVAVLGSWLVKMVLLIVVLVLLRDAQFYDRTVFGVVLLLGIVAALAVEALVVVRTRVPYIEGDHRG